jgi:hypothetical protein
MHFGVVALFSAGVLLSACNSTGRATDWKAFDDPKAVLLTDAFARSINGLPDSEKAAAIKRLRNSLRSTEVEVRRRER